MTTPQEDAELRAFIDKALDEFEKQIRIDITNHINGDKSRNSAFSHIDARKDIESIIKARDEQREREIRIDELRWTSDLVHITKRADRNDWLNKRLKYLNLTNPQEQDKEEE